MTITHQKLCDRAKGYIRSVDFVNDIEDDLLSEGTWTIDLHDFLGKEEPCECGYAEREEE